MKTLKTARESGSSASVKGVSVKGVEVRTVRNGLAMGNTREAIAIFDSGVENSAHLAAGLYSHITPYFLSPDVDGIRQLTQIFQRYTQPLTVYVVTHGFPGSLTLGTAELSLSNLDRYAEVLRDWLQPDSELLLYGCNVAAGDAGEEFLDKLHQLTGASIAASTRRVGNAQQGGTWNLDVVRGEMAIALPFSEAIAQSYPGVFPVLAIEDLIAAYETAPPGSGVTYTAPEVAGTGLELYTYTFQAGDENDLVISGFTVGEDQYDIFELVDRVELARVDNPEVTGNREIFWYEIDSIDTAGNTLDLKPSFVATLQDALVSQTINRGGDNVFANQGSNNVNNIERVDFIINGGVVVPANEVDDVGFLLLERGGNDPFRIAPITALDASGAPAEYGSLITLSADAWGGTGIDITSAVLNDLGGTQQPGLSASPPAQELSGIFISFEALGIEGDEVFFGYSVFPEDVGTDLIGLSDANLTTSQASGAGGLDLVAGSAIFRRDTPDFPNNTAPILNLDPTNVTGGLDDQNFDTDFIVGGDAVRITAPDATLLDPDPNGLGVDVEALTITTNVPGGANELLIFGTTPLPLTDGTSARVIFGSTTFNIGIDVVAGDVVIDIASITGGAVPNPNWRTLLRSLSYDNLDPTTDLTERTFTFVANDGQEDSNIVTSTIDFLLEPPENTPPILNLDPSNISDADDRNFETNFVINLIEVDGELEEVEERNPVQLTAPDATLIDPDNDGVDVETLTITVNAPSGVNETLIFASTPLSLTDGASATVTFGSTTFDIVVDVLENNAEINIASVTGGDVPNADWRTLLRSLSYNNMAPLSEINADPERVFTFVANDGLANSNLVDSTVQVALDTNVGVPSRDCADGLRVRGDGGKNRLVGSAGTDFLRGFANDDELLGLGCPDRLLGGAGRDRLEGGGAGDTLEGGAGRDRLAGQNGNDVLFGGGSTDRLNGGKGNDRLSGQNDRDFLRGRAGDDRLRGGQGDDGMAGGAGSDRITGAAGVDQMFGGSGRDRMRGGARDDRMFGGTGSDRAFGQNGNDVIRGEAGSDIVKGNAGNDSLFGGTGNDRVFGGALNDTINGGAGNDRLNGQRGDDNLRGGRQRDRLIGGAGSDSLFGGQGNDDLRGKSGRDNLRGNQGADNVFGDAGKDRIFGGLGNDKADGGAQNDTMRGNVGADVLFGKAGNDNLSGDRGFDRLNGGQGNDELAGGGAADRLIGKAANDLLQGLAGNDNLLGNNGRDTLNGGTGQDTLVGGGDGDRLQGGREADTFAYGGATFNQALLGSLVAEPDDIVDFNQPEGDRFSVNFTEVSAFQAPTALFNAGTVVAPNLRVAAVRAARDRNPNRPGDQRLGARQALFFEWEGRTHLLVNNADRNFNSFGDLVVNVTGIEFKPGDANRVVLTASDYFA